jgi:hypothetical protein
MRMVSRVEPTPVSDLARCVLDRLEIVPCGVTEADSSCLLVRYFNFQTENVEGDNYFETLDEALIYAAEVYGVSALSWCVLERSDLNDARLMYQEVRAKHLKELKNSGGHANGT